MLPAGTFAGEVVLITGGGTGLGKAMAVEFARLGAAVAIASRDEGHRARGSPRWKPSADAPPAWRWTCDRPSRSRRRSTRSSRRSVRSASSSTTPPATSVAAIDLSPNGWRAVVDIVLNGTFNCAHEFAARRIARAAPGAILNIGATYAWTGGPGASHSAAAKAGVDNLTMTLAVEWAEHGIRVNTLAPGMFPHEDMAAHMTANRPEGYSEAGRTIPAGRVGRLHELGWAATYLCSPFATYVSGHTFVIDGANWQRRGLKMPLVVPIREQLPKRPPR
jgi:NAD(P)-dependent dehydrogenase (short-subunit alcohol dehydrogenase family)